MNPLFQQGMSFSNETMEPLRPPHDAMHEPSEDRCAPSHTRSPPEEDFDITDLLDGRLAGKNWLNSPDPEEDARAAANFLADDAPSPQPVATTVEQLLGPASALRVEALTPETDNEAHVLQHYTVDPPSHQDIAAMEAAVLTATTTPGPAALRHKPQHFKQSPQIVRPQPPSIATPLPLSTPPPPPPLSTLPQLQQQPHLQQQQHPMDVSLAPSPSAPCAGGEDSGWGTAKLMARPEGHFLMDANSPSEAELAPTPPDRPMLLPPNVYVATAESAALPASNTQVDPTHLHHFLQQSRLQMPDEGLLEEGCVVNGTGQPLLPDLGLVPPAPHPQQPQPRVAAAPLQPGPTLYGEAPVHPKAKNRGSRSGRNMLRVSGAKRTLTKREAARAATAAALESEKHLAHLAKTQQITDTELLLLKPKKKRRAARFEKPVPSRFCHVCSRTPKNVRLAVCSKIKEGVCRKVICEKCFTDFAYGSFDDARNMAESDWVCPHCTGHCPERAQCNTYQRINDRLRVSRLKMEKPREKRVRRKQHRPHVGEAEDASGGEGPISAAGAIPEMTSTVACNTDCGEHGEGATINADAVGIIDRLMNEDLPLRLDESMLTPTLVATSTTSSSDAMFQDEEAKIHQHINRLGSVEVSMNFARLNVHAVVNSFHDDNDDGVVGATN